MKSIQISLNFFPLSASGTRKSFRSVLEHLWTQRGLRVLSSPPPRFPYLKEKTWRHLLVKRCHQYFNPSSLFNKVHEIIQNKSSCYFSITFSPTLSLWVDVLWALKFNLNNVCIFCYILYKIFWQSVHPPKLSIMGPLGHCGIPALWSRLRSRGEQALPGRQEKLFAYVLHFQWTVALLFLRANRGALCRMSLHLYGLRCLGHHVDFRSCVPFFSPLMMLSKCLCRCWKASTVQCMMNQDISIRKIFKGGDIWEDVWLVTVYKSVQISKTDCYLKRVKNEFQLSSYIIWNATWTSKEVFLN